MADSVASIFNMALANIGSTVRVSDPAESTKAAVQCSAWWPTARRAVLRTAPWPFATQVVGLAQIPFATYTPPEYAYAYGYPDGCLRAIEILTGCRQTPADLRIPFKVVSSPAAAGGGVTRYLLCDLAPVAAVAGTSTAAGTLAVPSLRYIADITDVSVYTPDVDIAISWALAALIAMPMAMDKNLKQTAEQMARQALGEAVANALNEGQDDAPLDSSFQLARG